MSFYLKGESVVLIEKNDTGEKDEFGTTIFEDVETTIENVLINSSTASEVLDSTNFTGEKNLYTLAIPKSDTHDWINNHVRFWGKEWNVISETQGIESLTPLDWNKKVVVERYDN